MVQEPDIEKLRSQWAESDREFMRILESVATPQSDLAKSYVNADRVDDLIELVGEPLCMATASLFFALESPGPLNVVARVRKRVSPAKHYQSVARTNAVFSECLLWVLAKLKEFCATAGTSVSEEHSDLMAVSATSFWYRTNRFPEEERSMLQDDLIHAITSRASTPPKDDKDQLQRVMDAYEQKPSQRTLARFMRAAMVDDPLRFVEPVFFAERYRILTSDGT